MRLLKYSRFILLSFLMLCITNAYSAHIVGGDFSYRHITGDTYEFKMKMYRDCGGGGAPFEFSLDVGIYDKETNAQIEIITMPRKTIYPIRFNTGCTSPQLRCVETGIFTALVELPKTMYNNTDGYYIQWERCCRNDIIKNIVNPGGTPMAFYMEFPSPYPNNGAFRLNSSPEYLRDPLNYLCVGEAFKYDFKIKDADGDETRMKIGIPNAGGYTSRNNPMQNTGPAPYDPIIWSSGYNVGTPQNVMDGNPDLYVDNDTAFIYLVPTQIGVYVISVICEEYRNGVKIGEVVRELQLEVLNCPPRHKPEITTNIVGANSTVNVFIDQQVCFDIQAKDNDVAEILKFRVDTVGMYKIIGNSASLNPSDISGTQNITTRFCWTPTCPIDTGSGAYIDFIVYDNSCPFSQDDTIRVKFKFNEQPNIAPTLKTNKTNNTFDVHKEENLCFQFQGTDLNSSDIIKIEAIAENLDVFKLGAKITPDVLVGNTTINGEFCWTPRCDLQIDSPIYLSIIIYDNSCPISAYDTLKVKINVLPMLNEAPTISAEGTNVGFNNTISVEIGKQNCFSVLAEDIDPDDIDLLMQNVNYDFLANGATFNLIGNTPNAKRGSFCWTPTCDNFYGQDVLYLDFVTRDHKCENEKFDTVRVTFEYLLPSNINPLMLKPDSNLYNLNAGYSKAIDVSGSDVDPDDMLLLSATPLFNSSLPIRVEMAAVQGLGEVQSVLNVYPDCGLEGNVLYPVELKLLSNKYCNEYDTISRVVNFKVAPLLDFGQPLIPQVFSPNGDGVNDEFKINLATRTICPDEFEFIIFDRWGQKMLETKDPEFVWRGENCTAGAYVYYLRVGEQKASGFIALVK